MFITAFSIAHHLSLSWASPIQSTPPHPTSWISILILSSHLHLDLPRRLFPFRFLHQNPIPASFHPHPRYMPAHLKLNKRKLLFSLHLFNLFIYVRAILGLLHKIDTIRSLIRGNHNYRWHLKIFSFTFHGLCAGSCKQNNNSCSYRYFATK
jgi:hypothetical protein